MKLFIIKVYVLVIRLLYAPMKLCKTQDKILWLSRQSDKKSLDMLMLEKAIREISPNTKQVFRLRCLKDEKSLSLSYIIGIFGDMWQMASAKVVITDTYSIPVSCLHHKPQLKVIQMWHALGAVKKFSLQSVGKKQGRNEGVAKSMHMHENYDYVIAPSRATAEFYKEGFGCKDENIKIFSLPVVDYLLDGNNRRDEFLKLNPQFKGKKIISYIPTFRDNDFNYLKALADEFKNNSEYSLVTSPHPLSEAFKNEEYKINGDFTSRDLMKLADAIVTDYSACAFEGAILNKPLYFYVPDYEEYKNERGLNVDILKEMKAFAFEKADELVASFNNQYDFQALSDFANRYVENKKTNNTERLADFVCSLLKN